MNEFWHWWQHLPSKMDPILFEIGPLKIQYYGLMYIVGFAVTYFLVVYRIKREDWFDVSIEQVQNLTTAMIVGLIVVRAWDMSFFTICRIMRSTRLKFFYRLIFPMV